VNSIRAVLAISIFRMESSWSNWLLMTDRSLHVASNNRSRL
jgi:hypothetical protein